MMKFLSNKINQAKQFIVFMIRRFFEDDCLYHAAALTFNSLLSIVPLMLVGLSIFSAFPSFMNIVQPIQDFIFENFVPATGKVVQQYLETFTAQASSLSVWGILFLVVVATLLMFTIERAMNKIWRTTSSRQGISAFLLYWAVLSLAPILVGVGFVMSSYVTDLNVFRGWLVLITPFLLSVMSFTFFYIVVPNCRVKFLHGFLGAIFAACLFEIAKYAFIFYFQWFHTYELLYGAFATVPLFFLWVYWAWVIVLLGGEAAHALSAQYSRRAGAHLDPFSHALHWLSHLWFAQKQGKGLTIDQLIALDQQNYDILPDEQIRILRDRKFIKVTDQEFILIRDLSVMTLDEFSRALPWALPHSEVLIDSSNPVSQYLGNILAQTEKITKAHLSATLADIFQIRSHAKVTPSRFKL